MVSGHVAQAPQPDLNKGSPLLHIRQLLHKAWIELFDATHRLRVWLTVLPNLHFTSHTLLENVSLCIVQCIFPVVTPSLRVCAGVCRCFGGWTRSLHRGSISPPSTGSSLTPSTLRSASMPHPPPHTPLSECCPACSHMSLVVAKTTVSAVTGCAVLLSPDVVSTPKHSCAILLSAECCSFVPVLGCVAVAAPRCGRHFSSDCFCMYICIYTYRDRCIYMYIFIQMYL